MTTALQAAIEYGGWDLWQNADIDEREIRDYFTAENFATMYPGCDATACGGYSLEQCAEAVIEWKRDRAAEPVARIKELQAWEADHDYRTEDLVREWANCSDVKISEDGSVYIADPQEGHWLDDAKIEEFLAWNEARA